MVVAVVVKTEEEADVERACNARLMKSMAPVNLLLYFPKTIDR